MGQNHGRAIRNHMGYSHVFCRKKEPHLMSFVGPFWNLDKFTPRPIGSCGSGITMILEVEAMVRHTPIRRVPLWIEIAPSRLMRGALGGQDAIKRNLATH